MHSVTRRTLLAIKVGNFLVGAETQRVRHSSKSVDASVVACDTTCIDLSSDTTQRENRQFHCWLFHEADPDLQGPPGPDPPQLCRRTQVSTVPNDTNFKVRRETCKNNGPEEDKEGRCDWSLHPVQVTGGRGADLWRLEPWGAAVMAPDCGDPTP